MKNFGLFALVCLLSVFLGSCSNKEDDKPPVMGTAEYDGQTVYFIASSFITERPRWDSGLRIMLQGLNSVRFQRLIDGGIIVNMWFPVVEDQEPIVDIYENADIGALENLSFQVVDENRNIIYDKDRETDDSSSQLEHFKIVSGTFSLKPVSAAEDTHYMISFDLSMSDGKTFKGGATIPQGAVRYIKN